MKPANFKTEGIVLKRQNYKEADRLVTIFTQSHGKITVIAKGARKLTSKNKSGLEICTHAWFYIAPFHDHFILTQTAIINSFPILSTSLPHTTKAQQLLEIVSVLTPEEEPNPQVFDQLIQALLQISNSQAHKDQLIYHVHHILVSLGFATDTDNQENRIQYIIEELIDHPLRTKKFLTPAYVKV